MKNALFLILFTFFSIFLEAMQQPHDSSGRFLEVSPGAVRMRVARRCFWECSVCNKIAEQKHTLERHALNTHHDETQAYVIYKEDNKEISRFAVQGLGTSYSCTVCNVLYWLLPSYQKHLKTAGHKDRVNRQHVPQEISLVRATSALLIPPQQIHTTTVPHTPEPYSAMGISAPLQTPPSSAVRVLDVDGEVQVVLPVKDAPAVSYSFVSSLLNKSTAEMPSLEEYLEHSMPASALLQNNE